MGLRRQIPTAFAVAALLAGFADAHTTPRFSVRQPDRVPVIRLSKPRPAPAIDVVDGTEHGLLDLNVKPKATEVWIDGDLLGTCDAFDGYPQKLALPPGHYRIRLVTPDGIDVGRYLRVRPGVELNVALDLR